MEQKTIREKEVEAFLDMAEQLKKAQADLARANDRIRDLESQVFGGSTK